jgi:outer membrane protein OmpA-like peptidoglycan-associated protein
MKKFALAGLVFCMSIGALFAQSMLLGTQCTLYYSGDRTNFAGLDRATLTANQKALDSVISAMKSNPQLCVRISAYGNRVTGSAAEQQSLMQISSDRAAAIQAYLILYGIPQARIQVNAFGGLYALTGPHDKNGWMNRRVVLTLCKF